MCSSDLYKMSPWRVAVIAVDVVIGLGIAVGVVANVRRTQDAKAHPEKYRSKKGRTAA